MKKYNRFSLFLSSVLLMIVVGGGLAFSASFSAQQFLANLFAQKNIENQSKNEEQKLSTMTEVQKNKNEELLKTAITQKNFDFLHEKNQNGEKKLSEIFVNPLPFFDIKTEKLDDAHILFSFSFVPENSDILVPIVGFWNIPQQNIQIFSHISIQKESENSTSLGMKNVSDIPFSAHHTFFLVPSNEEVILTTENMNGIIFPGEIFWIEKQNREKFSEKIILENIEHSFLLREKI